jgi:hypothetical protein
MKRQTLSCTYLQLGDPIDSELAMFKSFVDTNEEMLVKYFVESNEEVDAQLKAGVPDDRFDASALQWTEAFGRATHYCQLLLLVTMLERFLNRLANDVDRLFNDLNLTNELAELKKERGGSMTARLVEFVTQSSACAFPINPDLWEVISDLLWTRNRIVHEGGFFLFDASSDQAVLSDAGSSTKAKKAAQKAIKRHDVDLLRASRNLARDGFGLLPADSFPNPRVDYEITISSDYVLGMVKNVREFVESMSEGFQIAVRRKIEEIHVGPRLVTE